MSDFKSWQQLLWGLLFLFMVVPRLRAQEGVKFLYLDEAPVTAYLDYLINSGRFHPTWIFQQPYELDTLLFSAEGKSAGRYFRRYWQRAYGEKEFSIRFQVREELRAHNGTFFERGAVAGIGQYLSEHVTVANRTAVDEDYKYDPRFAGDLSEADRIFGRVNDAYLNLRFGAFNAFIGRMKRNWGAPGSPGLILSDHPYTYDHLLLSYTTRHFRLSLIFAQLEDLAAQIYDPLGNPPTLQSISRARKYLVGHRLDVRLSDQFQFALTEMATYGGPNRNIDFLLLNPANFYYAIQRNDRRSINGKWSLDLFYQPQLPVSFYFQFLLDDIVLNTDEPDEREKREDRFALTFSVRNADLLQGLNLGMTYVRVWNRTYQAFSTWENYHFRELSLGYPCASCEEIKLKWDYWGLFPLYFGNESILGRYGSVRLTDFYPYDKASFPLAPVTNNFFNELTIRYFYHPAIHFWLKARYVDKEGHYANRIDNFPGWTFFLGSRFHFGWGLTPE